MTNATASKSTSTKTSNKPNGSTQEPTTEPVTASTAAPSPAPTEARKPITVMVGEVLHRKVKITAELSGISLSDLVEEQLRTIVKERLPGLLASLGE